MSNPSQGGPRCPNHGVKLVDLPSPLPPKGTGICPISSCEFDYEVDLNQEKTVYDKFGNMHKEVGYNLTGEEKD